MEAVSGAEFEVEDLDASGLLAAAAEAERLTVYYRTIERLLSPDLIVVGGGVSKEAAEFLPLVDIATEIVPAKLENRAGIVGAALWAAESSD